MSQNKHEYTIPVGWFDTALDWFFKILWFAIAALLALGIGHWLAGTAPAWVPARIVGWIIEPAPAILYVIWRLNGGKIRLRRDELVIEWRGWSEEK